MGPNGPPNDFARHFRDRAETAFSNAARRGSNPSNARSGGSSRMNLMDRNGNAYVSASELERGASVAIKRLPGSDAVVACSEDRCARVKGVFREGSVTWVSATELANALGFGTRFSDDRRQVRFEAEGKPSHAGDSVTHVGDLAPNFRLPRLDGSAVSLADFRGRRVLIQSWASW